jgi:hypothetical protein
MQTIPNSPTFPLEAINKPLRKWSFSKPRKIVRKQVKILVEEFKEKISRKKKEVRHVKMGLSGLLPTKQEQKE